MFESLLAKIASALDCARIPYMVIGGQAVLLYGQPRLTRGIDIAPGVDNSNLNKLLQLTSDVGLRVAVEDVQRFVQDTNVLPVADQATGIRVDFIFSFSDYERQAIGRTTQVELDGTPVKFAAVEDLIIHKLVAGRPRDIEDVRGILSRPPRLDREYLRGCLHSLGEAFGRDLTKEFTTLDHS